jgi:hypothetical protein
MDSMNIAAAIKSFTLAQNNAVITYLDQAHQSADAVEKTLTDICSSESFQKLVLTLVTAPAFSETLGQEFAAAEPLPEFPSVAASTVA